VKYINKTTKKFEVGKVRLNLRLDKSDKTELKKNLKNCRVPN